MSLIPAILPVCNSSCSNSIKNLQIARPPVRKWLVSNNSLPVGREEAIVKEQSTLLTQSLSAADLLFGNSEWQKAWLQNPETFRKTLTDFARQWHENTEKLHQLERQESAQKAECESLASFLPSLEKQAEESGQLRSVFNGRI